MLCFANAGSIYTHTLPCFSHVQPIAPQANARAGEAPGGPRAVRRSCGPLYMLESPTEMDVGAMMVPGGANGTNGAAGQQVR